MQYVGQKTVNMALFSLFNLFTTSVNSNDEQDFWGWYQTPVPPAKDIHEEYPVYNTFIEKLQIFWLLPPKTSTRISTLRFKWATDSLCIIPSNTALNNYCSNLYISNLQFACIYLPTSTVNSPLMDTLISISFHYRHLFKSPFYLLVKLCIYTFP